MAKIKQLELEQLEQLEKIEKNNLAIAFNVLYTKKEKKN